MRLGIETDDRYSTVHSVQPSRGSVYVVVDEFGAAPYPDTLTAAWRKALAGAGLPHARLHDARQSCATLMHRKASRLW